MHLLLVIRLDWAPQTWSGCVCDCVRRWWASE
jgi:hypothetical protein